MTDLPDPALALAALAVLAAYTVFGFGGFGANLVALPMLAHVMPIRFAVPMLLVLDLFAAGLMGLKNRPLIDLAELKRLVPPLLVGMAAGLVVLKLAAETWLLLLLGSFVLAVASSPVSSARLFARSRSARCATFVESDLLIPMFTTSGFVQPG